jgi:hypothetical protein
VAEPVVITVLIPEERALARVSKDGHGPHGSRRAKTRSSP